MGWSAHDYLMAAAVAMMFIVLIINKIEWRYLNKHRKEITRLLYGNDPFLPDKKLSWADQLIMVGGVSFAMGIAWKEKNNKKLPKEGLRTFAPNIMENDNYKELLQRHPKLIKILVVEFIVFSISIAAVGIASSI